MFPFVHFQWVVGIFPLNWSLHPQKTSIANTPIGLAWLLAKVLAMRSLGCRGRLSKAVGFCGVTIFLLSLVDFREDKHVFLLQNNHPLYVSVIVCICIYIKYILSHFFKKPSPRQRQIESRAFFAVLQVWFILLILNGLKHLQKTIQPQKLVETMAISRFVVAPKISLLKISNAFVLFHHHLTQPQSSYTHFGGFYLFVPAQNLPNPFFLALCNKNTAFLCMMCPLRVSRKSCTTWDG